MESYKGELSSATIAIKIWRIIGILHNKICTLVGDITELWGTPAFIGSLAGKALFPWTEKQHSVRNNFRIRQWEGPDGKLY